MDVTAVLRELSEAYDANRVARKTISEQVKRKHAALAREEIEGRQLENDIQFARRLADLKERYGLKVTDIQKNVLRTTTWSRWKYWADLAGVVPEREIALVAHEEAKDALKPYRIEDGKIIVLRNEDGPVEPFEVETVINGVPWGYMGQTPGDEHYEDQVRFKAAFPHSGKLAFFLKAAFEEAGEDITRFNVKADEEEEF